MSLLSRLFRRQPEPPPWRWHVEARLQAIVREAVERPRRMEFARLVAANAEAMRNAYGSPDWVRMQRQAAAMQQVGSDAHADLAAMQGWNGAGFIGKGG